MHKMRATENNFLSIAATDTTGEAGIIKDCKVANFLGFDTLAVVTAITTQNDDGLLDIYPVQRNILLEQLQVCTTFRVNRIKIGALGNLANGLLVAENLHLFPEALIVWDPVFSPTSGKPFIRDTEIKELTDALLPLVDLVTPNFAELLSIIDCPGKVKTTWQKKTQQVASRNKVTFVVTGGHTSTEDNMLEEFVIDETNVLTIRRERKPLRYHHGTGCTFSTALACLKIDKIDTAEACRLSSELVEQFHM